uniref:Uncharacterized protein n=1 Tax=Myoviridae sp. ctpjm1 TaxID=2826699 RepID=A0A8S5NPD9_9CAUD|nr:MAG TPA: hypothetical protein [Myoviridae sp. ctpjm1]DAQ10782.1 MAG TPA: hypothetical protein [Caudoviricetes sp.]
MTLEKLTAWAVFAVILIALAVMGGCEAPKPQIHRQQIQPAVFAEPPEAAHYREMAEAFEAAAKSARESEKRALEADQSTIIPPYEPVM